jgi:hypothetical protein
VTRAERIVALLPEARAEVAKEPIFTRADENEKQAFLLAQMWAARDEQREYRAAKKAACLDGVALTPGQHADIVELNHRSLRRAA